MYESIDNLYARWQQNPDVSQTVALCDALRGSRRMDLVEIVGSHAARQLDIAALTAAARMYTHTGRLDDAQQVLIAAGRLAPRDGSVYRWLGEVLLRRGDAERAEKVLERAVQFGSNDDDAQAWLDRARSMLTTQLASGTAAVAAEMAQLGNGNGNGARPMRPPQESVPDDVDTQVRKNDDVKAALAASASRPMAPVPAAGRPAVPAPKAPPPRARPPERVNRLDPAAFDAIFDAALGAAPLAGNPLAAASPFAGSQTESVPLPAELPGVFSAFDGTSGATSPFLAPMPLPAPAPAPIPHAPNAGALLQQAPVPPPAPPVNPFLVPPKAPRPVGANGQAMPEARDVLEALQVSGIFEPDGAVRPQVFTWDKPAKGKRRIGSVVALVGLAALIVGGATGTYHYVTAKRAKQHVEAEQLLAKVDADLAVSDAHLLEPTEQIIARTFDLESRSPHAALSWLHERGLVGLLKSGENVAFEDGTVRAKEVGVPEKKIAFAYVASFLFQGDTAGAASVLAKWDGKADDDAFYQLMAGATFERAGDPRSMERYAAAVKLDPGLVIAQILLARATAVDGDPHHAAELAREFHARYPTRVEGATLVALAWARDPMRDEPPAEAKEIAGKADELPTPLKAVAPAVRGLLAVEAHKNDEAKTALQHGLAVADTPGIAAWLGSIALATGDEALARKSALTAVSFSAVYPPARMLAARVALLGARLDEAVKAAEELPAASPDVAVVMASVAYEKLDMARMRGALEALPDEARKLPVLAPLVRGQALMAGSAQALGADKALDMATDDAPWSDLVAMDAALDRGDLELAHKIAATWDTGRIGALRAVRLARLARWDGKNDDADRLSRAALEGGTVTVRALAERVFVLVAMGKHADSMALFKAYPNVGGPLVKWLRAYAVASNGKLEEARAIVSSEDPPPALAPLPARTFAAMAYGAVKDTRHGGDYVKEIASAGFASPDIVAAADKVGAKITPRKR